jgi:hypothetical protein
MLDITTEKKNLKKLRSKHVIEESDIYPGIALNLSKCSKIKSMHVCLNDIALKASESSYIVDTLSSDTSCDKKSSNEEFTFYSNISSGNNTLTKPIHLANLCNCVFT